MKVKVTKVNGNNNDFVLLLKKDIPKNLLSDTENIKILCKTKKKRLVDGLLVLKYIDCNKSFLDYYNNDGTWETLCVNGIRCAALFIYKKYNKNSLIIQCGDGEHRVEIINDKISVSMREPQYITNQIQIEGIKGYFINSGAKHFITEIRGKWPSINELTSKAKIIRFNTKYFPDGVNVNFFKMIDKDALEVVTYEKGIENIVESCASGSYACAYHIGKNISTKNFTIINSGGNLHINFSNDFKKNYIIGNAQIEKSYFKKIK